jgi:hypothetical protein
VQMREEKKKSYGGRFRYLDIIFYFEQTIRLDLDFVYNLPFFLPLFFTFYFEASKKKQHQHLKKRVER